MQQLDNDFQEMTIDTKKSGGSFLDIVGADIDSSYDRPVIMQVVQDTFHITVGGQQDIGENRQIQINIDDDNCIHYLHKYGIVCDLTVTNGFVDNAAALFDGTEMQIGGVSWSTTFQKYYAQQKLTKLGKRKMEMIAQGLVLKHDDFSYLTGNTAEGDLFAIDSLVVGAAGNAANSISTRVYPLQAYVRMLRSHYLQRSQGYGNDYTLKVFVPLPCIFAALWELPDDGAIFTGLGQKIKLSLKTNQASECVLSSGGGAPSFRLDNVSLVRFYSKLDTIRADLCLKSSVMFPKLDYVQISQPVLSNVINVYFPISAKDRIRGLMFAFHTNVGAVQSNDVSNAPISAANVEQCPLGNAVAAQFKAPLAYFPQLPIIQIDVEIGGNPYTINMSQIQFLHISNYFGDQLESYSCPLQRQLKCAYYIDLSRFCYNNDLYGSSSKNVTSAHFQITLKTGTKTLYQQTQNWGFVNPLVPAQNMLFSNFTFQGYLETMKMFECKNGIYQNA